MSEDASDVAGVIAAIIITLTMFMMCFTVALCVVKRQNDNYCSTIPLERMDKKRCGVQDE